MLGRLAAPLGRAAVHTRRVLLLLAAVLALGLAIMLASILAPANTAAGPSPAEPHACDPAHCLKWNYFETRAGCRRFGEKALAGKPQPNLDWEHHHCIPIKTVTSGTIWRIWLFDLGAPG